MKVTSMDEDFVTPDRGLLCSDDEYDGDHDKLTDAIYSMDGKKKSRRQRSEIRKVESSHAVSKGKAGIDDLELDSSLVNKKPLNRVTKTQKVEETPLHRHEQQQVIREVAYNEVVKEVSKWDPIVEKNRKAETLSFPLQKPDFRLITASEWVKGFKPRTKLEKEVARLLGRPVEDTETKAPLTKSEEKARRAMDLAAAKEHREEQKRFRAFMMAKEIRAKREKRIKSKKYKKLLRKERKAQRDKQLDDLKERDPEAYIEKMSLIEKQRVQERASLKHGRGASNRMQKAARYGKFDDAAREMVQQMKQKSRELTQKVPVVESESEESSSDEDDGGTTKTSANPWMGVVPERCLPDAEKEKKEEQEIEKQNNKKDEAVSKTKPLTPKTQPIRNKRKKEDEESEEENSIKRKKEETDCDTKPITPKTQPGSNKRKKEEMKETEVQKPDAKKRKKKKQKEEDFDIDEIFTKLKNDKMMSLDKSKKEEMEVQKPDAKKRKRKKQKERDVDENDETDGEEDALISSSTSRKQTLEDFDNLSENETEKEEKRKNLELSLSKPVPPTRRENRIELIKVDTSKVMTVQQDLHTDAGTMVDDEDERETQRMTIKDAFGEDDVMTEFAEEKKRAVEAQKPKDIDLALPGWGSWVGPNMTTVSKKKRKRFTIKAPPAPPRKDAGLQNVIISQNKDTTMSKHQVSQLPPGYTNIHQFQYAMSQPIGREWNPETVFRKLIAPKVTRMQGTIIEPINKEDTFKHMGGKKKADVNFAKPQNGHSKRKNRKGKKQT